MSEKESRLEHPLPAVVLHWVHLLSFFALILTGLYIHSPVPNLSTMAWMRNVHFITMYVFILTTVIRIYWAFFGKGSADVASVKQVRDYKHFALNKFDLRTLGQWVRYYLFLRKTRPYAPKYNPLQKLAYGWFFPLVILFMALTGFALFTPTAAAMSWFTNFMGGQNGVRLWHFWGMWVLVIVFLVHLYLVFAEDFKELPNMLVRYVPHK
jgi:Ni/Fe-hydrogenase 1 B-type cytochrome subunit